MPTFKLTLAYDGTNYCGWQLQPRDPSVQAVLEAALFKVTGQQIRVTGSSRTDSGVHAYGQVVSLRFDTTLVPVRLLRALNASLPDDIRVLAAEYAADDFHAIGDARRKRYRYVIHDAREAEIFRRGYCWHVHRRLDADAMHRAGQGLIGTHDFRSFETNWPTRQSSVRTIYDLLVERGRGEQADFVHLEVEANGFLYNMVRTIAGTLVEVGRGRRTESWPAEVVTAQNRSVAGMTAPPHGLFLLWIKYGDPEGEAVPPDA